MAQNSAPVEIEKLIRQHAPDMARQIRDAAAAHPGDEANFRRPVERLIEEFAGQAELETEIRHECTLLNGRADSVYNRLVVEYEAPGSLRKDSSYRGNRHAIEQVKGYIQDLVAVERRRKPDRLAGVALDGHWYIFVRFKDGRWEIDDPLPVRTHSTERFLRYLNALSTELPITPGKLIQDFGENTPISRTCVTTLYQGLTSTGHRKVRILFDQWCLQFSQICGYEPGSQRLDLRDLGRRFGVTTRNPDAFRLFFAIHTYYATFIKLLAVQIASFYAFPRLGTGLQQVANYSPDELHAYLAKMERGGVFKDFGINNFLEGDFFGWYLDIWDEDIDCAVREIIKQLANYSLVTLDVDPEATRDLLKRVYQNLMPRDLRRKLGEFYTPDWLAERLLNQLGYTADVRDLPSKRILDPACGSGTFLVLAIRRIRQWAARQKVPVPEDGLLEQILANVVGFDLNPLAVISARTNYLLALGDLLQHRRDEVDIPVYLADSILTPSTATDAKGQTSLDETNALQFRTTLGPFAVPQALVSAAYIDRLAELLEECVSLNVDADAFRRRLLHAFPLDERKDAADIEVILALFNRLAELDREQINGLWARIIKNAFAPLFCEKFDYVAGNPPWVNWANLPGDYAQSTRSLWQRYKLFPHTGLRARLGSAMDDISILMLYAAADTYLKSRGALGFVITQTVFKSEGGGEGFRRFQLGDDEPIKAMFVDDMVEVKPFEGAQNRTSVVIVRKGQPTTYPVPYTYWRKKRKGTSIPQGASLEEAAELTKRAHWIAEPVNPDKPTSPWLTGRPLAVRAVRRAIGPSPYRARKGSSTSASGVYWLQIIGTRPDGVIVVNNMADAGNKTVPSIQAPLEADFVYPLLRGSDVRPWQATPAGYILVPHDPEKPSHGLDERKLSTLSPKTYGYLREFRQLLEQRPQYVKLGAPSGEPWYCLYNVGPYTFAEYQVVWREVATELTCAALRAGEDAILGRKPTVTDHTLCTVACSSMDEAHYLSAALNSSTARFIVQGYVALHPSPHIMKYVRIPPFDASSGSHQELCRLSQGAHEAAARGDTEDVGQIEAEIDKQTKTLWGLTDAELKDIRDSLEDLRS